MDSKRSDRMQLAGALAFVLVFSGILSTARHIMASSRLVKDSDFAIKAAQSGLAEVKMGQLAQSKGADPAVKTFGNLMVADHTNAGDALKQIASLQSINLPTDLSARDNELCVKLSQLDGDAFDKEYARLMVKDHLEDMKEFEDEARAGRNQYLKGFAGENLPAVQRHLQQAREMAGAVGADTAM